MAETEVKYNRAQFEAAYRALVQCSHAIRHIDVVEVKRWVQKVMTEQAMDAEKREGLEKLLKLIDAFSLLRDTMKETGVPRQPPIARAVPQAPAQ